MDVVRPVEGAPEARPEHPVPVDGVDHPGLDEVLRRLRAENFHLKLALRHRAVIEQAKGLLAARGRTGVDEAFAQLVRAARDTNKKLADVAASYVAEVAGPPEQPADDLDGVPDLLARGPFAGDGVVHDPTRSVPAELVAQLREHAARRSGRSPTPSDAALRLALAGVDDAASPRELLASVVADCVWPASPTQGALYAIAADGSLELLASAGFERHDLSIWRRVPPVLELPVLAAAEGRPQLIGDPEVALRRFPDLAHAPTASRVLAALPIAAAGHRFAVVYLGWPEPVDFGEDDRRSLTLLAEGIGRALLPMLTPGEDQRCDRFAVQTALLLEAFAAPGMLVRPAAAVPAADWHDVLLTEANASAVSELTRRGDVPTDPVGRTLLEVTPWSREETDALVAAVRQVLAFGHAEQVGTSLGPVRVSRWQDGAIVTWQPPRALAAQDRATPRLDPAEEAEPLLRTGSFVVDPHEGTVRTSRGLRRLLGHDPQAELLTTDDGLAPFSPTSRARLREAVTRVASSGTATTLKLTLANGFPVRAWLDRRQHDGRDLVVVAVARQPT